MSDKRYEANIIRATAVEPANNLESTSAPGVWSIDEVVELQKKEKWPTVGNVVTNVEQVFSTFLYEGNGANQVIENGIALGNSNDGGSVEFDGTGDYLNLSTPVVPASGQFSLEAFIYPTATTDEAIASQHADGETGRFIFRLDNGKLNFNWAASELTDANSITANAWSHCLVTRDASNVIRLFVNGALRKSTTNSVTLNQNNFTIGASRIASPEKFFNGFISNVRVVSGAIPTEYQTSSTTEGAAIYTTPTTGLTAVSNTALLTCQGSTPLVDNSSNSYAITTNADSAARAFGPFTGTGGEGGLVWFRDRDNANGNFLFDTERGATKRLRTHGTFAENTVSTGLTAFNSNGFTIGSNAFMNGSGNSIASWTWRKQPKFFDVITWTGDGTSNRTLSHSLGSIPGMIIAKSTSTTTEWMVWHTAMVDNEFLRLNTNDAQGGYGSFYEAGITSTTIGVSSTNANYGMNINNATYVAYIFAHNNNDGGFGPDQDADIIKCGSYTGNGSATGPVIDLGFEPQFVMIKSSSASGSDNDWYVVDTMRRFEALPQHDAGSQFLKWNTADGEPSSGQAQRVAVNSTGFSPIGASTGWNISGQTYIYMAIRRPQAAPTAASQVFNIGTYGANRNSSTTDTYYAGFPVDMALKRVPVTSTASSFLTTRMLGTTDLKTNSSDAERTGETDETWDSNTHWNSAAGTSTTSYSWMWKRARGYFDVTTYVGTNNVRTVNHNLGVVPEMIWLKCREGPGGTGASYWVVYHKDSDASAPQDKYLYLDTVAGVGDFAAYWNDTAPTSTVFTTGASNGNDNNASGQNYVAYLFATLAGVSKLGSYTGSSSGVVTVDCGFTSGARFVLIKRTDASGGWYVYDSARGINSGADDPYLLLNATDAEATNTNNIEPHSSGFQLTQQGANPISTNGASYIFYAIA